jgi:hypothetical protein
MATTYDFATFRLYRPLVGAATARRKSRLCEWPTDEAVQIISDLYFGDQPPSLLAMQKATGATASQVLRVTRAIHAATTALDAK